VDDPAAVKQGEGFFFFYDVVSDGKGGGSGAGRGKGRVDGNFIRGGREAMGDRGRGWEGHWQAAKVQIASGLSLASGQPWHGTARCCPSTFSYIPRQPSWDVGQQNDGQVSESRTRPIS
jgi:hypothetical protein